MKIAQIVQISKGKSGLYETTREICCALRALGHDARMIPAAGSQLDAFTSIKIPAAAQGMIESGTECDPATVETFSDRGAISAGNDWLLEADVLLAHSGLDESQRKTVPDTPVVQMLHGAPEYCFRMENGSTILQRSYWEALKKVAEADEALAQPRSRPWWSLSGGVPPEDMKTMEMAGEAFEKAMKVLAKTTPSDAPGVLPGMRAYSSMHAVQQGPNRDQWAAFVTMWPEHVPYWQVILPPEKLHCVQSCVDLDWWDPAKVEPDYEWGGHKAEINVVCSSSWRAGNVDIFDVVTAYWHFAKAEQRSTKLHIYGNPEAEMPSDAWRCLVKCLRDDDLLGEMPGWRSLELLRSIYRTADLMITPHHVASRGVREAMAMGCPVVAARPGKDAKRTAHLTLPGDFASAMSIAYSQSRLCRVVERSAAVRLFNPAVTAEQLVDVIEGVLA